MNYEPLLELKAGDYSWSLRRYRLFESCRRAYFLHYFAANHGVRPDSPEILRLAYELKHLKHWRSWAVSIITGALQKAKLQSSERGEAENDFFRRVEKEIARIFRLGRMQVFDEQWRHDPKTLNLYEVYYRGKSPEDIFEQAWDMLRGIFESIKNSELYFTLLETERIDLKYAPGPLSFTIGDFPVWLAAAFVVQRKPGVDMFIFGQKFEGKLENLSFQAGLYKIAAAANNWSSPDAVRTIFVQCADADASFHEITNPQINISAVLETVSRSATEMRALIRSGNQVVIDDFPGSNKCDSCRFKKLCRETNANERAYQ
jgi:hypothetical protein